MLPGHVSDPTDLAASMAALSNPARIHLMHRLRRPLTLHEIELRVAEDGRERLLSRQAVRHHLDSLLDAGLMRAREARRPYGTTTEFVVDHQRVYLLAEELRRMARLAPEVEAEGETLLAPAPLPQRPAGPLLLLVKGADEGRTFDLRPAAGREATWVVGRRRDVDVSLEYDPAVSSENSLLRWREGGHWLSDIEGSRNGTARNLVPLRPGEEARLRHGDLIGVGKSLLLYWTN